MENEHPVVSVFILVVFLLMFGLTTAFVLGILVDLIQLGWDAGSSIFSG